ncbi:hypothetical protein L9F63_002816, partial [Diploptera punctata]
VRSVYMSRVDFLGAVVTEPLSMPDAVFDETSGSYKPHDYGLQPENLLQDHLSNSGHDFSILVGIFVFHSC